MPNIVSYTFKGIDQYTSVGKQIAAVTSEIKREFKGVTFASVDYRKEMDKAARAANSLRARFHRFKLGLKDMGESFLENSKDIRNAGAKMTAGITLPFGWWGRSMIQAASDSVETGNKFKAVFGKIQNEADSAAKNLSDNFGLAGDDAKALLASTGDLLTGIKFFPEEALKMSNAIQIMAVDMASFQNLEGGAERASQAMTKALLGERESLVALGIKFGELDVKQQVLKNRAEGIRFATLKQEKAFATLNLITEQSKNSVGDFANSSKEYAGQARILSSRVSDLNGELGLLFLPLVTKIVSSLIELVNWVRGWSKTTQRIVLVILTVVAALGPFLAIVGAIGLALPAITTGMAALGITMGLAVSPIILIVGAIGLLIAGIILLWDNWDRVVNFFKTTIDAIGGWWDGLGEGFMGTISGLKDAVVDFLNFVSGNNLLFGRLGNLLGFGGEVETNNNNQTTIDVNLNAPQNTVKSVQSKQTGNTKSLNLGLNVLRMPG